MFGSSFLSLLLKTGASVDDLQAAYRRLAPLRTKAKGYDGPGYIMNGAQGRAVHARNVDYAVRNAAGFVSSDQIPQMRQNLLSQAPRPQPLAGEIIMPTGGGVRLFNRKGIPTGSPAAQRAANVFTGLHEGFERRTRPAAMDNWFTSQFGHASPMVLANEHRMIQRATGPGAAEAAGVFRNMRARRAEHSFMLDNVIRPAFGDRGAEYYAQNGATKAMRKALTRKMNAAIAAGSSVLNPKWTSYSSPGTV
jgi:hypothetical protein